MYGYVRNTPVYYPEVHQDMEQLRHPGLINPLTAGLIGVGLGFLGGGLLAGGPGFGPGPWYGPGPFYGPGYGPGFYGPTPYIGPGFPIY